MSDTKGYIVGDWNAYCDYCEGQYMASQLKTDYWGFKACPKDFTLPNPQMFVRVVPEKIVVPWSRPVDGAAGVVAQNYTTLINTYVSGTGPDPASPDVNLWNCPTTGTVPSQSILPLRSPQRAPTNIEYTFSFTNSGTSLLVPFQDSADATFTIVSNFGITLIRPGTTSLWRVNKVTNTWLRVE